MPSQNTVNINLHLCQIGEHYRQGRLVLAGVSSVRTNWPNYAE